jgi:predicted ATPase/DNA-binding SARP family transcriptional activator
LNRFSVTLPNKWLNPEEDQATMMEQRWRIELFGGLRARQGDRLVGRFRTQKTGALLAYLAYFRGRTHGRETLIELLWPEVPEEAGRHSLSQALSSLRNQLEPPGIHAASVIVADKLSVELNPDAFTTDVSDFELALRQATLARNSPDHEGLLANAFSKYGGTLLDGYYEEWITAEQERIAGRFRQAATDLLGLLEKKGSITRAGEFARRAVEIEPLNEELRRALMRTLASAGRPAEAVLQYRELERLLESELGVIPQPATRELLGRIEHELTESARVAPPSTASPAGARTDVRRVPSSPRVSHTGLPYGTVTFLFTDIEGSTALWERFGDTFRSVLSLHHTLLRNEFRRNGGVEVKESGDSFLVAFRSALDAVSCAVACQRAIAAQDWPVSLSDGKALIPRVRMAVHTGEVQLEEAENPGNEDSPTQDYHGVALHRASRMLSAAHGGQILCSEATAALTRRDLDPSARLRDLGLFHLRDVEGPERLFQVDCSDIAGTKFPQLRATPATATRLPVLFTRFFGRQKELREIGCLLRDHGVRLVTLTGTGGTGKTRLAIELARQAGETDESGGASASLLSSIWFVPLADLLDPALIIRAIADAMGLPRLVQVDPRIQIMEVLREGPSLLVLDNFEQVVDGGAEVLQGLLAEVAGLKALVTSRLLLGLEGEQEFTLAPLATPRSSRETRKNDTPERVSAFESVRLFVDRAQAVKPDFQVTNSNAPAVAELCDRLEGVPLAIELAAARAQMMTPTNMLEQLANRFDFLVSRKRGAVERQRTLRSAMDWSYRLLAPDLQQFFLRLSVFRGGWTVEASEAVCEEPLALDFLAQLRDSSLVLPEESLESDRMRFRMLESLREYTDEKLHASGVALQATRKRHAEWYLHLASERLARIRTPDEISALQQLEIEIDNLRAAFEWAQEEADSELCARLSLALGSTLHRQGYSAEACGPLESALERCTDVAQAQPALYAELLRERAGLYFDMGECGPAREKAEAARALCNDSASPLERALAENLLGMIRRNEDTDDSWQAARDHFCQALDVFRKIGDARYLGIAYNNLGWVECRAGGDEEGQAHLMESLRLRRELGDRRGMAETLTNLGVLAYYRGDRDAAGEFYREAMEHEVALRHTFGVGRSLFNLGEVALEGGQPGRAVKMLIGAERLLREVRSPYADASANLITLAANQAGVGSEEREQIQGDTADLSLSELVSWALMEDSTAQAAEGVQD